MDGDMQPEFRMPFADLGQKRQGNRGDRQMHQEGKLPELLIPASGLEVLKTAVLFGADAVYIGGEAFSLRAKARNFTQEEMAEGIRFAHEHGVKVYVTVNILAHNEDLEEADEYLAFLNTVRPDALLVADPGLFMRARKICPQIDLHISTQANNVNYETFLFWRELGAKRVVCGRELSLKEIRQIRERIPDDLEIEAFVHGAMCISYSGRCLMSNFFTGRDANRGACTHPCRWKYSVVEETRPGEYMPVYENERGTYIFNSKDLCMIEHIPDMIAAGIDSLKIEGRMKTALYVASAARTYRKALDDYARGLQVYEKNMDWYREQIRDCTYRSFTTGFFYGKPGNDAQIYDSNTYVNNYTYLGTVQGFRELEGSRYIEITQKNKFCVGEEIEIMKPDFTNEFVKVESIRSEENGQMDSAPHPKQKVWVKLSGNPSAQDLLRRKEKRGETNES
jgi:putative protease